MWRWGRGRWLQRSEAQLTKLRNKNFSSKLVAALEIVPLSEEIPKRLGGEDDRHKLQSGRQVDNKRVAL